MKKFKEHIIGLNLSERGKQTHLSNACRWNMPDVLEALLEVFEEKIDTTFDEGELFKIAALQEHIEILTILIDYYKKTQLDCFDKESLEYKFAKRKLGNVIEDVLESYTVSDKVMDILKDYLPKEEDSGDTDDDLDDYLEYLSLDPHHIPDEKNAEDSASLVGDVNK